jgi:hypothetical protein
MRYVTAILGAILIFAGIFLLSAIALVFLPAVFRTEVHVGGFYTNNLIGVVLGSLGGSASFRATIRHAKAKNLKKDSKTGTAA